MKLKKKKKKMKKLFFFVNFNFFLNDNQKTSKLQSIYKPAKAKLLQLKLIHIFARAILLMKKLEIKKN